MKKVAATRGQRVRRMDFFLVWLRGETAGTKSGCEMLAGAVAVANFYGFLLRRLTLTTASPLYARGSRVGQRFPGISAKLVRKCEITGNRRRCKKFLANFRKVLSMRTGTEVMTDERMPSNRTTELIDLAKAPQGINRVSLPSCIRILPNLDTVFPHCGWPRRPGWKDSGFWQVW